MARPRYTGTKQVSRTGCTAKLKLVRYSRQINGLGFFDGDAGDSAHHHQRFANQGQLMLALVVFAATKSRQANCFPDSSVLRGVVPTIACQLA